MKEKTTGFEGAPNWLTRQRIALYSACILLMELAYLAIRIDGAYVRKIPDFFALGWDFAVFWTASLVTLHGAASNAYDVALTEPIVSALEHAAHRSFPAPWVYPPTFLLAVKWLALLPFAWSYMLFTVLGMVFSGFTWNRILAAPSLSSWLPVLAFPALWITLLSGQNSLFTFGLAAAALVLLDKKPALAGVCIGLLAIKPQLGIVFPLVLLVGRRWRAFSAALITVGVFCAAAGFVLGFETFSKFIAAVPQFSKLTVDVNWAGGMPTWFGIARHFGASPIAAYLTHAVMAAPSLALAAFLFAIPSRATLRAAVVAPATLLCQPYLRGYDFVWLALPIAFLILDARRHGWLKGERAVLVTVWLAPLVFFFPTNLQPALWLPPIMAILAGIIFRRARMVTHPIPQVMSETTDDSAEIRTPAAHDAPTD